MNYTHWHFLFCFTVLHKLRFYLKFHFLLYFKGKGVSSRSKRSVSANASNNGTSPNVTISYSLQPQTISVRTWNPNIEAWETNIDLQVHVHAFKVNFIGNCIYFHFNLLQSSFLDIDIC